MKILKEQFTQNGWDFVLLNRTGDVGLLMKTKQNVSQANFEVVIIQRHNGYKIADTFIEAAESLPSSSTWGINGWTYCNLADAKNKFNQLVEKFNSKTK